MSIKLKLLKFKKLIPLSLITALNTAPAMATPLIPGRDKPKDIFGFLEFVERKAEQLGYPRESSAWLNAGSGVCRMLDKGEELPLVLNTALHFSNLSVDPNNQVRLKYFLIGLGEAAARHLCPQHKTQIDILENGLRSECGPQDKCWAIDPDFNHSFER